MPSETKLPESFDDLSPFVSEWGNLETQDERYRQRQRLSMDRLNAYYETVCPRLKAIFDHLDSFPYGPFLPPAEALLFRVVMAMSEVAQSVEVFGQPSVPWAPEDHSVPIRVVAHA
jgi:hypothetical protein